MATTVTALPEDGFGAAMFLLRQLYRPIDLLGAPGFAVAETKLPCDGDTWFWSDDNAKVFEFLSRPELWNRFPSETGAILDFVRAMCRGPFIFRRLALPRLERGESRDGFAVHHHSLMNIAHDLRRGVVTIGMRFHDQRAIGITFAGHGVEFNFSGKHRRLAAEYFSDVAVEEEAGRLTLRHAGDLFFRQGLRQYRLGRIAYCYRFNAGAMAFEAEASMDIEPGLTVSDIVLTIGHQRLGDGGQAVTLADSRFAIEGPIQKRLEAASAIYYQIRENHVSSDAGALHTVPAHPEHLAAIELMAGRPGRPNRTIARYAYAGPQSGRLVAAELKLLTAGGLYERVADYAVFVREAAQTHAGVLDYSTAYDYGVVINAFAKGYAVLRSGAVTAAPPRLADELKVLFDTYLDVYFQHYIERLEDRPNAICSRELAFVILGLVTVCRVMIPTPYGTTRYQVRLAALCDALLRFEVCYKVGGRSASAYLMRQSSPLAGTSDCHAASLMAFAGAMPFLDDPKLAAAVDRGLASYDIRFITGYLGTHFEFDAVSTLMMNNRAILLPLPSPLRRWWRNLGADPAIWSYKAGLTLRLFTLLQQTTDPELRAVWARHSERMVGFEALLRRQLASVIAQRDDGVEILASPASLETNSETQPWTMLGILGHPWD